MNGLNDLTIIGNVVRDAELTNVDIDGTQTPRCRFSVAVNETKDVTTYFDVTIWRDRATNIAPWIRKGRLAYVKGSVRLNQYVSNGTVRSSLQIHDAKVVLLDKKPNAEAPSIVEVDDDELPFG